MKISKLYEEAAHALGFKDWNTLCGCMTPNGIKNVKQRVRSVWQERKNSEKELANTGEKNVRKI